MNSLLKPKVAKYAKLNKWLKKVATSDLPKMTRYVLLQVGIQWMDENLHCFPSLRTIGKNIGMSPKIAGRHINLAKKEGWLLIIHDTGPKQGWKRNRYFGQIPNEYEFNKFGDLGNIDDPLFSETCSI